MPASSARDGQRRGCPVERGSRSRAPEEVWRPTRRCYAARLDEGQGPEEVQDGELQIAAVEAEMEWGAGVVHGKRLVEGGGGAMGGKWGERWGADVQWRLVCA